MTQSIEFYGWTVDDFIKSIGKDFPALSRLVDTPQDSEWHAEGNVHIHTDMVLTEAYRLIESDCCHLTEDRAKKLILSALFHDYGKPFTTGEFEMDGKVRIGAPRHEELGAAMLFFCDPPFGLSQTDWLDVVQLCAYHHIPKRLVVKNMGGNEFTKLSRKVRDVELLYWLEIADFKGRTASDESTQLEHLELFQMMAQEYGMFSKDPYAGIPTMVRDKFPELDKSAMRRVSEQIISRYEDGQIFMFEEELAKAYEYKDTQSHVVMMCGLPGSGKSTFIQNEFDDKYEIISLDLIREELSKNRSHQANNGLVVNVARERLKEHLRNKKNVVWDATNFRRDFRRKIAQLAYNYGAYVEIILMHTSLSQVLLNNKNRVHSVPMEVIENQCVSFQLPDIDEAHSLRVVSWR